MGVLDDLKQEVERRKQELSEEDALRIRQEETYQTRIRPAMQAVFRYLNVMTEYLNFLKPETLMRLSLPGYGEVRQLVQEDYRMAVDSTERPQFIKLWFTRRSPHDLVFSVTPRSQAEDVRKFLQEQRLEFSQSPLRDAFGNLIGLGFEVIFRASVIFLFRTDIENGLITMRVVNFEGFKTLDDSFRPETISSEWLDDLGSYILGRNVNLRALHISETERQQIRQRLRISEAERKRELEAAKEREQAEKQGEKNAMLRHRILRLVQQTR